MKGALDGPAGLDDRQTGAYGVSFELPPRPVLGHLAGLDSGDHLGLGVVEHLSCALHGPSPYFKCLCCIVYFQGANWRLAPITTVVEVSQLRSDHRPLGLAQVLVAA